jgi:hypothetical protein
LDCTPPCHIRRSNVATSAACTLWCSPFAVHWLVLSCLRSLAGSSPKRAVRAARVSPNGNRMNRRFFTTACFGLLGFASVLAWGAIDVRLCKAYPSYCRPKPGVCGGIDVCSSDAHMIVGLALVVLGPPFLFAILGYQLSRRNMSARQLFLWGFVAVVIDWSLTVVSTRVVSL